MNKKFRVLLGMLLVVMSFAAFGSTAGAAAYGGGSDGGFEPVLEPGNGGSCFGCRNSNN